MNALHLTCPWRDIPFPAFLVVIAIDARSKYCLKEGADKLANDSL
jgi:hypothetical protein